MKKEAYPAPQVKVIVSPRRGSAGRRRGRLLKEHYMQKKQSYHRRNAAIAVVTVLVIIAVVMAFIFLFPGIQPGIDGDEKNLTPIPFIEVTNGVQSDSDLITVDVDDPVIFSAINSTDSDGTIEKYKWDFGDGNFGDGVMVQHTYNQPDKYEVTLEIKDNHGKIAKTHSSILVNAPPIAIIDMILGPVKVNSPVTISGSNSNDPDWQGNGKGISSYKWDFGDGFSSTGMNTTHIYTGANNYTITLTVWDFYRSWNSASTNIQVNMRNFKVSWNIENETALTRFGYTRENETTELSTNITQNDLWMVTINFNWTDFLPLINISDNSDEFRLSVISPSGQNRIINSTTELIIMEFSDINKYDEYTMTALSAVEASQKANVKNPPSDKETGEWKFYITAVDCRGGILLEENRFVGDSGNSWRINIDYYYYTADISEM